MAHETKSSSHRCNAFSRWVGPQEVKVRGKVFAERQGRPFANRGSPHSFSRFSASNDLQRGNRPNYRRENRNLNGGKPGTDDEVLPYHVHIQVDNEGGTAGYGNGPPLAQEDPCRTRAASANAPSWKRIAIGRGSDSTPREAAAILRPGILDNPIADHLASGAVRRWEMETEGGNRAERAPWRVVATLRTQRGRAKPSLRYESTISNGLSAYQPLGGT